MLRHGLATGEHSSLRLYGQADQQASGTALTGLDANNRARAGTVGGRWDQSQEDGTRLSIQGQALQSIKHGDLPLPDFSSLVVADSTQTIDRAMLTASFDKPISADSELHAQTTAQNQHTVQSGYADQRASSFDLDVQHRWHPKDSRHDVTWGAGLTWYRDATRTIPLVTFDPASRTLVNGRIFGQHEYALVPNQFVLTYGARVDHDEYSGAQASPNARLLWKIDPRSSAWIAASRAVRAPARGEAELGANLDTSVGGNPATLRVVTNPDARIVEKVVALESGWRSQVRHNLSVDVAAFVQHYSPLLGIRAYDLNSVTLQDLNVVSDTLVNGQRVITISAASPTRATTHGIELATDWRVTKAWRQQLAFSYMQTQFSTPMVITTLGGTPHSLLSLRESFDLSSQWMLDLWLRYTSARHDPVVPSLDVPSRTYLDINLRWLVSPAMALSLGAHNLGPRYTQQINPNISTQVERAAFAKIETSF
jgi:iron complex outermembrane receptor protein